MKAIRQLTTDFKSCRLESSDQGNSMDNRISTLQYFSDLQRTAQSSEDVKAICDEFSQAVDLEYYLFGICRLTSLSSPEISTITNYPDDWMKTYFEEGFQRHDPVVRYCFDNIAPISWSQLLTMDQYITPEAEKIFEKASEIGLKHGLSIPVRSHTGDVAIFSLATKADANVNERFEKITAITQMFATELFNTISRININQKVEETQKENLTPREVECLFWACEGKTTWEISKIIEVSERTVIFHLTSATKKLGAVNRQHAVAKAMATGLIKPML